MTQSFTAQVCNFSSQHTRQCHVMLWTTCWLAYGNSMHARIDTKTACTIQEKFSKIHNITEFGSGYQYRHPITADFACLPMGLNGLPSVAFLPLEIQSRNVLNT